MRLIAFPLSLILVSGLLTACGTASHRYTVGQIKGAFAAQGVRLQKSHDPPLTGSGVVVLRHGTKPHFIAVLVETASPAKGPLLYLARSRGERRDRVTKDGNLIVSFDPSDATAVSAAIASLR